jgi:hypothetical protein
MKCSVTGGDGIGAGVTAGRLRPRSAVTAGS